MLLTPSGSLEREGEDAWFDHLPHNANQVFCLIFFFKKNICIYIKGGREDAHGVYDAYGSYDVYDVYGVYDAYGVCDVYDVYGVYSVYVDVYRCIRI